MLRLLTLLGVYEVHIVSQVFVIGLGLIKASTILGFTTTMLGVGRKNTMYERRAHFCHI